MGRLSGPGQNSLGVDILAILLSTVRGKYFIPLFPRSFHIPGGQVRGSSMRLHVNPAGGGAAIRPCGAPDPMTGPLKSLKYMYFMSIYNADIENRIPL